MSDFNTLKLLATVSGFRELVVANRLGCKSSLARTVHDNLIAQLGTMIAKLHTDIEFERTLATGRGTPKGDFLYDIFTEGSVRTHHGLVSLLDPLDIVIEAEGESIIVAREDYTLVPADDLEGLAPIIEAINREFGTAFLVARVEGEP